MTTRKFWIFGFSPWLRGTYFTRDRISIYAHLPSHQMGSSRLANFSCQVLVRSYSLVAWRRVRALSIPPFLFLIDCSTQHFIFFGSILMRLYSVVYRFSFISRIKEMVLRVPASMYILLSFTRVKLYGANFLVIFG